MAILVTGGCGYIGSHTVIELDKAGFDVIIGDNFYNSSPEVLKRLKTITGKDFICEECDFSSMEQTENLFKKYPEIDAVINFAAYKAVGESVAKPLEYYSNNMSCAINLLLTMKKYNVKNFVFSSSATVYGEPEKMPCTEDMFASIATSPYGWTKVMLEQVIRDYGVADTTFNGAILRYFNPIGAHTSGLIGEDPNGIPNNLLPYIAQTAIGKFDYIRVFGDDYNTHDGTGVRDYIHVVDLAKGHVAAVKKLFTNSGVVTYNLGTGVGYSVLDVIKAYEKACGKTLPYQVLERRAGDIATNYSDPAKAFNELGWKAEYGIEDMCEHSWNWQSNNPNGYKE